MAKGRILIFQGEHTIHLDGDVIEVEKKHKRRMKDGSYRKEKRWINKKLRSGVSKKELLNTVGMFSNKKKEKVMAQKGLTEQEYKKRYDFLSRVYYILSNE